MLQGLGHQPADRHHPLHTRQHNGPHVRGVLFLGVVFGPIEKTSGLTLSGPDDGREFVWQCVGVARRLRGAYCAQDFGDRNPNTPQSPGGAPQRTSTMRGARINVYSVDNRRVVFEGRKQRRGKVVLCVSHGATLTRQTHDFFCSPMTWTDVNASENPRYGDGTRSTRTREAKA